MAVTDVVPEQAADPPAPVMLARPRVWEPVPVTVQEPERVEGEMLGSVPESQLMDPEVQLAPPEAVTVVVPVPVIPPANVTVVGVADKVGQVGVAQVQEVVQALPAVPLLAPLSQTSLPCRVPSPHLAQMEFVASQVYPAVHLKRQEVEEPVALYSVVVSLAGVHVVHALPLEAEQVWV